MRALETAFSPQRAASIPPEVLQTLLALAEFMEHDENPLPIDIRKLGAVAENCQARRIPPTCSPPPPPVQSRHVPSIPPY